MLEVLQACNELLLGHFELLGLTLVFVDQLLFVVDLLSALGTRIGHPLVLEVGDRALAFRDHLADRLALHCLVVLVLHVELLLARQVILQLLLDCGRPLHLRDIHVVAGVLNLLAPLFLPFKRLVATFTPLLLSILCFNLLLQWERRVRHAEAMGKCIGKK